MCWCGANYLAHHTSIEKPHMHHAGAQYLFVLQRPVLITLHTRADASVTCAIRTSASLSYPLESSLRFGRL